MKQLCLSLGLCALALVGSQTIAHAEDWYYAGVVDNAVVYIDNDRVNKNDQEATVWVRTVEPDGETEDTHLYVNRDGKYIKEIESIDYDDHGQIKGTDEDDHVELVQQGPLSEALYDLIW